MKSILFARVSSREQEETGYSLPSQEKLLKEYAERKDFGIAKRFSISESASGQHQRRTFDEMLRYVKDKDIKIVICEKVDRLTRNLKDAVYINEWINKDAQRQVHFVKENCVLSKDSKSNEKFIWNIKVSVAQYYIDNLSEEVKKGQKEKIAQGWLPTKPPLGYKTTGEKGHKIHIIDQEKSPLVKKLFELYSTKNYSLKRLVETMHKQGLRTKGGNKLVKSRLANLLSDPFYRGKIRWNNKIYDGKHEPLISKELFDIVKEILKGKTTPRYRKHLPLFKGLLHCGECEGTITWSIQKTHWYGYCNRYRGCSQKKYTREENVEEQILKAFSDLEVKDLRLVEWIRKALKESHKDEIEYHSTSLSALNQKHEQTQKRLDNLYDDKLDENITKDFYDKKFKQYSEEKEDIMQSIQKLSQAGNKYLELGINIYELSQKARYIYSKIVKEKKRELLNLVFDKITLKDCKLSFKYSKPFEILSEAVRITNGSKVLNLTRSPVKIFEPVNLGLITNKNRDFDPAFAELLRAIHDVRTYLATTKEYFWLPDLKSP